MQSSLLSLQMKITVLLWPNIMKITLTLFAVVQTLLTIILTFFILCLLIES